MQGHKKIYLILLLAILVLSIFVIIAIKQTSQIKIKNDSKPVIDTEITPITIEKEDPILGNRGAEITIIEFLNFGTCKEECRLNQQKLMNFVLQHPLKTRLVWKDAPSGNILSSSNNELAHVTAYCVGAKDEKKFWEFVNFLTNTEEKISKDKLYESFKKLEIPESYMQECLASDKSTEKIGNSFGMARTLNLKGNLNLFIDNKKIFLDKDRDILEILDRLLEE